MILISKYRSSLNFCYLNRLIVLAHEGSRGVNISTSFVSMFLHGVIIDHLYNIL